MEPSHHRRSLAVALMTLAVTACGGGDSPVTVIDDPAPPPTPPPPTVEDALPLAAPVLGDPMFGVDLTGRLLVMGTESSETLSRVSRIRGVAILHRLVGIDFRPSTGQLYGVGSDSRVYVVDVVTSTATAVSEERFSPPILSFFDIHFGMAFDPVTEKIRLVGAENQRNWLIDPDDGTAVSGPSPRFTEGDIHEGKTPYISGLAFSPKRPVAALAALGGSAGTGRPLDCEEVLYAVDPDLGYLLGSCDPDRAAYESLGDIGKVWTRCTGVVEGPGSDLFVSGLNAADEVVEWGSIALETLAPKWHPDYVPMDSPAQSWVWDFARWVDTIKAKTGSPSPTPTPVARPSVSARATLNRPAPGGARGADACGQPRM